jgi:hypothetical protein
MMKRLIRKIKALFSKKELLDFYYSAEQAEFYRQNNSYAIAAYPYLFKPVTYAKGKEYTEIARAGCKPYGQFKD